jgi:hypothetical protein
LGRRLARSGRGLRRPPDLTSSWGGKIIVRDAHYSTIASTLWSFSIVGCALHEFVSNNLDPTVAENVVAA